MEESSYINILTTLSYLVKIMNVGVLPQLTSLLSEDR